MSASRAAADAPLSESLLHPLSTSLSSPSSSSSSPHPPGHRLLFGVLHPPGALFSFSILFAINLCNFIDRFIPSAVKLQIQQSYSLNNFESSLPLTVFILVYMLACPLFGYLADRGYSRRWLICGGVVSWSCLTAATAIAPNYATFVLIRGLIGVGEASYATIAPAIIADWYPPHDRSKVLGAFYVGTPIGAALGYGLGGAIGQVVGWRLAFVVIGLPGVLLGLTILRTVDPVRGGTDVREGGGVGGGAVDEAVKYAGETQWRVVVQLLTNPVFMVATVGQVCTTFGVGGLADWFPTYLQRVYHQQEGTAGVGVGAATVVGGIGGSLLGSYLGEKAKGRLGYSYFSVPGLGCVVASLFALVVIAFQPPVALVYALLIGAQLSFWCYLGPTTALTANCVPSRHRTRAFALSTFAQHALGDAASPSIIGAVADAVSLPFATLLIPVSWLCAAGVWLVGSWVLREEDGGQVQGDIVGGEEGGAIPHALWEEDVEGVRRLGGKEVGGMEGDGSSLISEEERHEEALEVVRDASTNGAPSRYSNGPYIQPLIIH